MIFRNTRRWIAVLLGIILPVLSAMWNIVLKDIDSKHPWVKFVYVGALACTAATAGYVSQLKPARDLEKPVLAFLNILGAGVMGKASAFGINPRLNLMLLHRPWSIIGSKRLRVVWGLGMDSYPDVRFTCGREAGVAGTALRTGYPVLSDCTLPAARRGLSPKQIADTSHVNVVWSWPIYEVDSRGMQTGRRIGVLSLDAIGMGDFAKLTTNSAVIEADLRKFRDVISTVV